MTPGACARADVVIEEFLKGGSDPAHLATGSAMAQDPMDQKRDANRSEADAELEREVRQGRKFSLAEAIGRMAGPGAMKGVSPVTRQQQALVEIENWLREHLSAGEAELQSVLLQHINGSDALLKNFDQPLAALVAYCEHVVDSDHLLTEVVREADIAWGRVQAERPKFEQAGSPPDPNDPYTLESVRNTLTAVVEKLGRDTT